VSFRPQGGLAKRNPPPGARGGGLRFANPPYGALPSRNGFNMTRISSNPLIDTLSRWYGRLLDGMLSVAGVLLLVMTLMICADVFLRNAGAGGVPPGNELSEDCLYLVTLLAAPGLLRQGQHIRVDIVLRMLPLRVGWLLEWAGDLIGIACCAVFVWYGANVTAASYADGAISIKTLVLPEWWLLAPMPVAFALLAIEFVFRMHRLALAERRPREDAVSAS
jgi:TRAP-type transport system small permease protein